MKLKYMLKAFGMASLLVAMWLVLIMPCQGAYEYDRTCEYDPYGRCQLDPPKPIDTNVFKPESEIVETIKYFCATYEWLGGLCADLAGGLDN